MMDKEKRTAILNRCPNYDNISNYVYLENDYFSKDLIDLYQDFVFSVDIDNKTDLDLLESVNKVMGKYISDYNFAKALKKQFRDYNLEKRDIFTENLMRRMVSFLSIYEEEKLKHISNTKWI